MRSLYCFLINWLWYALQYFDDDGNIGIRIQEDLLVIWNLSKAPVKEITGPNITTRRPRRTMRL